MTRLLLVAALGIPVAAWSQIPASETLSPSDSKLFQAEVRRVEQMLQTAGDKCTVQYALARTWASGGQYWQAMEALRKAVDLRVGLDPSRDTIFAKLRGTKEFEQLMVQVRTNTRPTSVRSAAVFTAKEADLFPEGMAFDPARTEFFLGSTYKHKIVACTASGICSDLVTSNQEGLGEVLGLKIDPTDGSLWSTSNGPHESALFHFSVPSGKLIRKYPVSHKTEMHLFNDLSIDSQGDVFVTDTQAGTVYWVSRATNRLEVFIPNLKVTAANGIATSSDGKKLYVAGFPDGLTAVDIGSRTFHAMGHPADLCLATIDGLAFSKGDLIAIQNGIMAPRVVRYTLTNDLDRISGFEVLERGNPMFDGITTGAVVEGAFYFMANPQLDSVADGKVKAGAHLNPIGVLRIDIPH
jgi:sugar lactone lactonase YvrE